MGTVTSVRIARRKNKRNRSRRWAFAAVACVVLAVILGFALSGRRDVTVAPASAVQPQAESAAAEGAPDTLTAPAVGAGETALPDEASPSETVPPTGLAPSEGAPIPLCDDPAVAARWTSTEITKFKRKDVRMLPILSYRKESSDKVAITIDDCFQFENIREILDLADRYGAKLTFFPIGYQIKKQPDLWQEILDRGHEIENHSFHHMNISYLTDEQLYRTIAMDEREMNKTLGVNYKMKYFRPKGGAGLKEPRLSKVLRELGYQAIASWGLSGSQDVNKFLRKCNGGHVVLFHTTDKDLAKLRKVIPALHKKGLKMVTLNEMYGKPANEITPLPPPAETPPPAAPDTQPPPAGPASSALPKE